MPKLTLAAFKRSITTGCVLDVTEHRYPALLGRRTVVKADTTGFYLALPENHPKRADSHQGSFVSWPRASGLAAAEDGSITLTSLGWEEPLMRFTVQNAAQQPAARRS